MNNFDDIEYTGTHADDHHLELADATPAALQRIIDRAIATNELHKDINNDGI